MALRCERSKLFLVWNRGAYRKHTVGGDGIRIRAASGKITELAEYYEKEIGYRVPSRTPFVGRNFNVTRAGIHADGLLKNEEIYNVFDTDKFLNRPPLVAVSNTSGLAGIAHWINTYFHLPEEKQVDKSTELVAMVKAWVDKEYEEGRVTVLTDEELLGVIEDARQALGCDLF